MAEKQLSRKTTPPKVAEDVLGGMAKVTLLIGRDTLDRLDRIVQRGKFGGRGRALDALLDSLNNCVDEAEDWWESFNVAMDKKSDNATKDQAEQEMTTHAIKVWSIFDRFFKLDWGD